ncbi:MAG: hypothetical protein LBE12_05440 [Planctomycetaceae bacterium]|jgi:hypothetical protein|nr:hypothetical protein [Planctomycetaceae bacterium]
MSNKLHAQVYEIRDRILSCVEAERIEVIGKISQCLSNTDHYIPVDILTNYKKILRREVNYHD